MKPRCPNCNGSIIRMGHKEKPFFCKSCNEWFSKEEVTPKQTNADRIRAMSDEELAEFMCKNVSNGTVNCAFCAAEEFCRFGHIGWLDWLKQECE